MVRHAQAAISAYKHFETSTYTDKRLILLKLFSALLDSVNKAAKAILAKNYEEKGKNIARAIMILGELNAALDRRQENELITNLEALYFYAIEELCWANLKNDLSRLKNVERILKPLAEAWEEAVQKERQESNTEKTNQNEKNK